MKAIFASLLLGLVFVSVTSQALEAGVWTREKVAKLDYWIYRPTTVQNRKSALMLSLHGCAQTADDFKNFANWENAAEAYRMTVVVPFVPNGGVYFGCWDYYGRDQTEKNKANAPLLAMTDSLLQRKELNLSPKDIFVSGLSSGSAQAMLLACLRPDLFRGVGLAAGPVAGSGVTDIYAAPRITGQEAAQFCRDLAGPRASAFARQTTSIIFDEHDSSVSRMHSAIALEAMTTLYGTLRPVTLDLTQLPGLNTSGKGTLLVDAQSRPRLSYIMNAGLGHAWPAGAETVLKGRARAVGDRFINPKSLEYPMYLGELFNSRRK